MRAYNTTIQLTWVQAADASQLRTASYKPYPAKSYARAAVIAKREKAVVAINGDYFVHRKEGYIVRNGQVLRQNYTDCTTPSSLTTRATSPSCPPTPRRRWNPLRGTSCS